MSFVFDVQVKIKTLCILTILGYRCCSCFGFFGAHGLFICHCHKCTKQHDTCYPQRQHSQTNTLKTVKNIKKVQTALHRRCVNNIST